MQLYVHHCFVILHVLSQRSGYPHFPGKSDLKAPEVKGVICEGKLWTLLGGSS